ncbi:hypothetical protein [Algoriphagus marinus]|uniref:hypothetical protein n=1 Tax=Algoriphagus marinus TaxID=1925762 RepID=UPI000A75BBF4|nr:hypothetical protein [Algoriphagus marinus]
MRTIIQRLVCLLFLPGIYFACGQNMVSENNSNKKRTLEIEFSKNVSLDISNGFPKLQGNPLFYSDETNSYFYIQTSEGIGTFDLEKGGEPVSYLKVSEIEGLRGQSSTGQNHFIPTNRDGFLYFDRRNEEIFVIENSQVIRSQKLARLIQEAPKPLSGALKFAIQSDQIVSVLNMLEVYGKPPFQYQKLEKSVGLFSINLQEFEQNLPLPKEYLNEKVNAYDLLISMDYNPESKDYIINFPILDDLIFTKDFESIRRLKATPKNQFVSLENRQGVNLAEWKKEYYTGNSFFTVYYDPFRKLYVRHYRQSLTDVDYDIVTSNSYKMFHPKNKNFLLFLDEEGNQLHTMDVSEFNHLYIHFGKEGMYILNDTELEEEDSLTFSLFSIVLE